MSESVLSNTYKVLTDEKKLTIGYIGGSVTNGSGLATETERETLSWRALTTKWFKNNFPTATITEKCMAIGGTGSEYAVHRLDRALLSLNGDVPDLVFIETAINDVYDSNKGEVAKEALEGIIKKLYSANPKCNIVIIMTGDFSTMKEAYTNNTPFDPGHLSIASHYNLPVIDVGAFLYNKIYVENGNSHPSSAENTVWRKYITDSVHPNAEGYAVYAEKIASYLTAELKVKNLNSSEYNSISQPSTLLTTGKYVNAFDVDFTDFNTSICPNAEKQSFTHFDTTYQGLVSSAKDDSFSVKFTGTSLKLWVTGTPQETYLEYSVDGGSSKRIRIYHRKDSRSFRWCLTYIFRQSRRL